MKTVNIQISEMKVFLLGKKNAVSAVVHISLDSQFLEDRVGEMCTQCLFLICYVDRHSYLETGEESGGCKYLNRLAAW